MPAKKKVENVVKSTSGSGSDAPKGEKKSVKKIPTKSAGSKSAKNTKSASSSSSSEKTSVSVKSERSSKSSKPKETKKKSTSSKSSQPKTKQATRSKTDPQTSTKTTTGKKVNVRTKKKSTNTKTSGDTSRTKKTTQANSQKSTGKKQKREFQKLTLVHAADEASFWVNEGPILKNLLDLHDALDAISDEQYRHHARTFEDNDFSRWVEQVLCDGDCAAEIQKAQNRKKAKDAVSARLRVYSL